MEQKKAQDKQSEISFYKDMYSNLKNLEDGGCITYGYEEIYSSWKEITRGGSLLDVGSGAGKHSLNLAKMGFKVVGVEISMEGIRAARALAEKEGQKILFVQGDVERLPFKEEAFETSFCGLILHHFIKREPVISEVSRVTRSNFITFEPNALEPVTFFKFNILNRYLGLSRMSPNQRALFPGQLVRSLRGHGFSSFKIDWLDIHRGYGGFAGILTWLQSRLFSILPVRFRSNKFSLRCRRTVVG